MTKDASHPSPAVLGVLFHGAASEFFTVFAAGNGRDLTTSQFYEVQAHVLEVAPRGKGAQQAGGRRAGAVHEDVGAAADAAHHVLRCRRALAPARDRSGRHGSPLPTRGRDRKACPVGRRPVRAQLAGAGASDCSAAAITIGATIAGRSSRGA